MYILWKHFQCVRITHIHVVLPYFACTANTRVVRRVQNVHTILKTPTHFIPHNRLMIVNPKKYQRNIIFISFYKKSLRFLKFMLSLAKLRQCVICACAIVWPHDPAKRYTLIKDFLNMCTCISVFFVSH